MLNKKASLWLVLSLRPLQGQLVGRLYGKGAELCGVGVAAACDSRPPLKCAPYRDIVVSKDLWWKQITTEVPRSSSPAAFVTVWRRLPTVRLPASTSFHSSLALSHRTLCPFVCVHSVGQGFLSREAAPVHGVPAVESRDTRVAGGSSGDFLSGLNTGGGASERVERRILQRSGGAARAGMSGVGLCRRMGWGFLCGDVRHPRCGGSRCRFGRA